MTTQSPLEAIRSAELAAAQGVVTAIENAEQAIAAARNEAVQMVDEARARGRVIADERYEAALAAAQEQAAQISRAVVGRIETLRREVTPEIDRLVDAMVGVVLPRSD